MKKDGSGVRWEKSEIDIADLEKCMGVLVDVVGQLKDRDYASIYLDPCPNFEKLGELFAQTAKLTKKGSRAV